MTSTLIKLVVKWLLIEQSADTLVACNYTVYYMYKSLLCWFNEARMKQGDILIPYSGLFLKQKFSQERQKLNFEELNFRRLQILKNLISLRVFEFESEMALTISSVVNKKRQCIAIMLIKIF